MCLRWDARELTLQWWCKSVPRVSVIVLHVKLDSLCGWNRNRFVEHRLDGESWHAIKDL